MTRLMASVLAATVLATPAVASADGFLSPFIGANFGGNTTERTRVYGGAIGFGGNKSFEIDFGYTPEFFADETLGVDGKLVTVMGNVMLGGGSRSSFSPYFVFGGGLIRTNISVLDDVLDVESAKNSLGGDVGIGFFAGGKSVKVRADVRYFRAFNFDDGIDLDFDLGIIDDTLGFWRGTVGIGFMW